MESENRNQWERFLTPQILRANMITATVYIATFEILKNSIIDRLRDFYLTGWDSKSGEIIDPSYNTEVLLRNKSQLHASLIWLKENDAIDDNDISTFELIKSVRNNPPFAVKNSEFGEFRLRLGDERRTELRNATN